MGTSHLVMQCRAINMQIYQCTLQHWSKIIIHSDDFGVRKTSSNVVKLFENEYRYINPSNHIDDEDIAIILLTIYNIHAYTLIDMIDNN